MHPSLPSPSLLPPLPPLLSFPQLLAWIDSVMPWLEDRSPETTLQDAQVTTHLFQVT